MLVCGGCSALCSRQRGFTPQLLNIVCDGSIAEPVRQAAVIYFKNAVVRLWEVDEEACEKSGNLDVCLADNDKALIKEGILDAVCAASESLRFKRNKDRDDIAGPISKLEPFVYYHCNQLLNNQSAGSVLIQSQGLKIIYVLTQFSIHFEMLAVPRLDVWIKFSIDVLMRECPQELSSLEDKDERAHTVWWKCKKWAAKILDRIFDRYGSPNQVEKQYAAFANHFLVNWSRPALAAMLMILNAHRNGIFVSDRVLFLALSFTNTAVAHSHCWRTMKPHALVCESFF
ncbi:Importin-beta protein [Necator americanus]|uniref:Importin-beta protein n=1 Tax=Necator americanus TaxID=51031 RepID=W2TDK6_NECAM|nr:Importin-beta protein [Necator americanus]ETN79679.1 Importin-beta protein [Necator americanus]